MARRKRLPSDAEQVNVRLTPEEQLVLQIIRGRRKKREEERTSPSEVVSDALWAYLEKVEGLHPRQIDELLAQPRRGEKGKVRNFPKKGQL